MCYLGAGAETEGCWSSLQWRNWITPRRLRRSTGTWHSYGKSPQISSENYRNTTDMLRIRSIRSTGWRWTFRLHVVFCLEFRLMISGFVLVKAFSLYSSLSFILVFDLFCLSFGFWTLGGCWHQTPCMRRVMQANLWPCAWSQDLQINAGQNGYHWLDLHKTKTISLRQKTQTATCCSTSCFSLIQKHISGSLEASYQVWGHWAEPGGDGWAPAGQVEFWQRNRHVEENHQRLL